MKSDCYVSLHIHWRHNLPIPSYIISSYDIENVSAKNYTNESTFNEYISLISPFATIQMLSSAADTSICALCSKGLKTVLVIVALHIERKRQIVQQVPLFQQYYLLQRCQIGFYQGKELVSNTMYSIRPRKKICFGFKRNFFINIFTAKFHMCCTNGIYQLRSLLI